MSGVVAKAYIVMARSVDQVKGKDGQVILILWLAALRLSELNALEASSNKTASV